LTRLAEEADTVGFAVGAALVVAGTAMVWVPAAFVLAGVILCAAAAALARSRNRQQR
jgi:asparagine N-glycosylation enzyme membrane subunit Stt3